MLNFLNSAQEAEKKNHLDLLFQTKDRVSSLIEQANDIFLALQEEENKANHQIKQINLWLKKIHKEKQGTIEKTFTQESELSCYDTLFGKFRINVPKSFDFEEVEQLEIILDQLEEMP